MLLIDLLYIHLPISLQRVINKTTLLALSFCSPSRPGVQGGCFKNSPTQNVFAVAPLSAQRVHANSIPRSIPPHAVVLEMLLVWMAGGFLNCIPPRMLKSPKEG